MDDLISRKAAMAFPLSWNHRDTEHGSDEFISGVECYRDYIEGLPSAQSVDKDINVPTSDIISRQAAIDIVRNRVKKYTTPCVLAVTDIQQLPSAQQDRSLWFRIGEICVDESKGFISSGRAIEKIRELLRERERE